MFSIADAMCHFAGNLTVDMLHIGSNVMLVKWAPQNDVLGHSATAAFVTQAGINSIQEAAYHAVPVVCVPLVGDQLGNAVMVGLMTLQTCSKKLHTWFQGSAGNGSVCHVKAAQKWQ